MPRYILIKLSKIKHKEKILKATREKQLIFQQKLCKPEGSGRIYLK